MRLTSIKSQVSISQPKSSECRTVGINCVKAALYDLASKRQITIMINITAEWLKGIHCYRTSYIEVLPFRRIHKQFSKGYIEYTEWKFRSIPLLKF